MRIKKSIVRRESDVNDHNALGRNEILSRVFANRGVSDSEDLDLANRYLLTPDKLSNIEVAANIVAANIRQGSKIIVVGDYDADGATSTALCILSLRDMGCSNIDYVVPNRFEYGYGLSPAIVDVAARLNPDLIITVDNGVASHGGVDRCVELGIQVVITDHHLPGENLPNADAIVNPNLLDDEFPSKYLAGVGVIFYLLSVVRKSLQKSDWFKNAEPPNLAKYLDLVALGTYADLVPLDRNNRILVAQGLKRINRGRCRPGITQLAKVSGRTPGQLYASDLGFQLAPRLNAAGRLEDMSTGIECLLADDADTAGKLANQLDDINRQRKEIETEMQEEAMQQVRQLLPKGDVLGLCIYDNSWHQGIVGLVASRLKERINCPVIVFAPGEGQELKGSARSIPGLHIRDLLCEIDGQQPDLIQKFGGHAMAAGLSIDAKNFSKFKQLFDESLISRSDLITSANVVLTDGSMTADLDDLKLIRDIKTAAPWGQGFAEPLFDDTFKVLGQRLVGDIHLKLKLRKEDSSHGSIDAIFFRYLESRGAPCPSLDRVHVAYRMDVNEYAGRIQPQLIIEHLEPLEPVGWPH
ncbi:MAG: single-stranded-DNA-specific exonuclease [Parasphingorhabdus sp.]|jgi:single-stranded-DNA-specific exonuclease